MNTLHPIFQQILKPYMPMNTQQQKQAAHTPSKNEIALSVMVAFNLSDESYDALPRGLASELYAMLNSHQALLDALRVAQHVIGMEARDSKYDNAKACIRAAIALAEQQP